MGYYKPATRSLYVAPVREYRTVEEVYACHNESCSAPPPPCYTETEVFYDNGPPGYYVMKTLIPAEGRRRRRPVNCTQIGTQCVGGLIYGTACCLAATLEMCCACAGGVCSSLLGAGRPRRQPEVPYSWRNYEVGTYEYDMVLYRRPRRNCVQKLFGC